MVRIKINQTNIILPLILMVAVLSFMPFIVTYFLDVLEEIDFIEKLSIYFPMLFIDFSDLLQELGLMGNLAIIALFLLFLWSAWHETMRYLFIKNLQRKTELLTHIDIDKQYTKLKLKKGNCKKEIVIKNDNLKTFKIIIHSKDKATKSNGYVEIEVFKGNDYDSFDKYLYKIYCTGMFFNANVLDAESKLTVLHSNVSCFGS